MFALHTRRAALAFVLGATSLAGLVGCESDAQTGALLGAGVGALAGQAIGRNTTGTLIGTGVGAAAGYAIGNESDKAKAKQEAAFRDRRYDPRAEPRPAPAIPGPPPSATPSAAPANPLAGTQWRIVSLVWSGAPPFENLTVFFSPDGALTSSLTTSTGAVVNAYDRYRVVADALIVEHGGEIVNAQFSLQGGELIVVAPQGRAVLHRTY